MSDTWEFYKDKAGEHCWRCAASNGNIIGAATEGYKAKRDYEANAKRMSWAGWLSRFKYLCLWKLPHEAAFFLWKFHSCQPI